VQKIKDRNQLTIAGIPSWKGSLSPRKVKLLEKTWAGTFQRHILPNLPIEKISGSFSTVMGRPSKELYTVMGARNTSTVFRSYRPAHPGGISF